MAQIPQNRQFQEAKVPSHWGTSERRYAQGVNDLLERLFYMFGRLSADDLGKPLRKQLTDTAGNLLEIRADVDQVQLTLTTVQGDVSTLTLSQSEFATQLENAQGNITTLQQTATGLQTQVNNLGNRNRTYLPGTVPSVSERVEGDLLIDTANGNILKRWNGSAWVAVQDGAISLAQQQADKIQWLVASGTSAANMTLTSQLYSLMAANIDLSANNSIKLAVGGGTNLLEGTSSEFKSLSLGSLNSAIYPSLPLGYFGDLIPGETITLRGYLRASPDRDIRLHMRFWDAASTEISGTRVFSNTIPAGSEGYSTITVTVPQGTAILNLYLNNANSISGTTTQEYRKLKLERGTMATDWSPAPSDPASGVKTSKVTIDGTGIAMTTGGTFTTTSQNFNIDAAGNVTMKGTVEAASGKIGGFDLINNSLDNKSGFKVDPVSGITLGSVRYGPTGFIHSPELYITAPNAGKHCDLSLETEANQQRSVLFRAGLSDRDTYEDVVFSLKPAGATQSDNYIVLRRQDAGNIKSVKLVQPVETDSSLYVATNCSALSFTDRTPAYFGDALDELRWSRASKGGIDHKSLPKFAQKTIIGTRINEDGEKEDYQEEGRDLGAMVSVLTRAVQQLADKVDSQQRLIEDLNRRVSA